MAHFPLPRRRLVAAAASLFVWTFCLMTTTPGRVVVVVQSFHITSTNAPILRRSHDRIVLLRNEMSGVVATMRNPRTPIPRDYHHHHHVMYAASGDTSGTGTGTGTGAAPEEEDYVEISDLPTSQIIEMLEVSFVHACLQLAKGYVDVLKLLIVAIKAAYERDIHLWDELIPAVDDCPNQTAQRALTDDEVTLRSLWMQAVYMMLDYVDYGKKNDDDDDDNDDSTPKPKRPATAAATAAALESSSSSSSTTTTTPTRTPMASRTVHDSMYQRYSPLLPTIVKLFESGGTHAQLLELAEQEAKQAVHPKDDNKTNANADTTEEVCNDPVQQAVVTQTIRVLWYTLTVLQEESEANPKPGPRIPGTTSKFRAAARE